MLFSSIVNSGNSENVPQCYSRNPRETLIHGRESSPFMTETQASKQYFLFLIPNWKQLQYTFTKKREINTNHGISVKTIKQWKGMSHSYQYNMDKSQKLILA